MPITATTLSGFPDAESTGVRAGVDLSVYNGDMTVTTDGAVISGVEIHGTLRIEADNVTIRDCKIVNDSYNAIIIPDPYSATVEHCDIVGGVNGISGAGTFTANDFSHNENGINIYGASLIEDNYIHDLSGGPDAHFDGIENNGASDVTIRHNTVINDSGQTSAVMINNYFGGLENNVIDNNYLAGGGYTVYSDARFTDEPISGVQFTNNVLGEGYYGYYAFMENEPLVSGNTELGKNWPTPVSDGAAPAAPPVAEQPSEPETPPVVAAPLEPDPAPQPDPVTDTPAGPETPPVAGSPSTPEPESPPVVAAPSEPEPTPQPDPVTDTPAAPETPTPPVAGSPSTPEPESPPVVAAPSQPDPAETPSSGNGGHGQGHAGRGDWGGRHDGGGQSLNDWFAKHCGDGNDGGGWAAMKNGHHGDGSMFAGADHLAAAAATDFMTGGADAFVF